MRGTDYHARNTANQAVTLAANANILTNFVTITKNANIFNPNNITWSKNINAGGYISATTNVNGVLIFSPKLNTRYYFCRKSSGGNYITWSDRVALYDKNMNVLAVYTSVTQNYDLTISDPNVAYIGKMCIPYNNSLSIIDPSNRGMVIEGWNGVTPSSFIPYNNNSNIQFSDWYMKNWISYGDSISAINNGYYGDIMSLAYETMWGGYVHNYFHMGNFYGRGVGSQCFSWQTGSTYTWYANADGSYADRPPNAQPTGTTVHNGNFCSWDRITTMIPLSIKNNINLIFVMGGTNDAGVNTLIGDTTFVAGNTTDPEWTAATTYNTYGGDYNITTFKGAIASTIMKLQAWCPNAIIVLGTQLNGHTNTAGSNATVEVINTLGLKPLDYAIALTSVAQEFSTPCIDVFGNTGINTLNSSAFINDGTHPSTILGAKALARAVIGGLKGILPNI